MPEPISQDTDVRRGTPGWLIAAMTVLGMMAVVGLLVAHNASTQAQQIQQNMESNIKAMQQDLATQLSEIQQRQVQTDTANSGLQSDLSIVTKRLRLTQGDLKKAREDADAAKTDNEKKLEAMDGAVRSELATKATAEDVKTVDGKVSGVRSDLSSTQNDLKMARSELGTLIARDHEDVEQLRRLGERDYVEFTIEGKNKPQKVGNVMVELRGTDLKHKRYNVALVVDDVRIEKKNLPVNEPIFFHQGSDRRPLEMVVNSVGKASVSGYVSSPKPSGPKNASSD